MSTHTKASTTSPTPTGFGATVAGSGSAVTVHTGLGNAISDSLTMIGRSIRLSRRNLQTLIMSIMLPLMIMAMFVYVFGGAIHTGTAYVNYVVPGIILLCTGYGAASTAVMVTEDMRGGMVDRLRSLPIRSSAMLTGHVVASVTRNALSTTIVVGAAVAMGFRPTGGFVDWVLAVGLLLLYVVALSWLGAGLGVIARTAEAATALSFFMLFLPYLSSAFVPTDTMPSFLRAISDNQPMTPVIETVRGLLTGTPIGDQGWVALAWVAGILVVSFSFATWMYKRRTR
ncbi:ABC transporter permease [Actinocrispum wychmicini]|uniref:Transport permease protein n=1 Tax=Actinocrispum wychmicini TaxID=1213861 RepID=A0A4R2K2F0_9PSEU|nr:ABC transporter permease [Actinocrispum wychmicini]TCO65902.1 ABC-2 type transport system permease protein [Actinocrispum wychmicini]